MSTERMAENSRRVLLIISQVYVPDPAAVGQHIADVAEEMARRGWRVVVYTSRRGYDDPSVKFPSREVLRGVEVRRLPLSSFGKGSIPVRLAGQALFMAQAVMRSVWMRRVNAVLVSTSPPFAGIGGSLVSLIRRASLTWWVMDINPDQMVTSGRLSATSPIARVFDAMNRMTLRRASHVVVLDRFMRDRILAKQNVAEKIAVIRPWAHEDRLAPLPHAENPFRTQHGLSGKFVVMYSGNHGFSTPVATLLSAAQRLASMPDLMFVFIGGGVVKKDIDAIVSREKPPNILSLPYQPIEVIRYSLSAADVQVVSIANETVGVAHSCKIYGAMAIGRPVLSLGPRASHAGDIVVQEKIGWACEQGDVEGLVATLLDIVRLPREELEQMGSRAMRAIRDRYSRQRALNAVCDLIEDEDFSTVTERVA
jgi:glycosyltransferase involved in cell wall biosynthesis